MKNPPEQPPRQIAGYAVLDELAAGHTYLVMAPGPRRLVLKVLDEDCLLRGQLHPSVRERLARVRELAHAGIANLHGVERDGGIVYLVWEYVEGTSLADPVVSSAAVPGPADGAAAQPAHLLLARELLLTVGMLHARGIVHGAIHGRNIILDRQGRMRLTHISPYLYTDTGEDTLAIVEVLTDLAARSGPEAFMLGRLMTQARDEGDSLESLQSRLSAAIELRADEAGLQPARRGDRRRRLAPLLAALGVSAAAVLGGWVLWHRLWALADRPSSPPQAPATMVR